MLCVVFGIMQWVYRIKYRRTAAGYFLAMAFSIPILMALT